MGKEERMNHDHLLEELDLDLDVIGGVDGVDGAPGRLEPARKAALAEHVAGCATCQ